MSPQTLAAAYTFCREVARREARNFYYAFRVLPKPKSDAMCAIYAFMRRADDIADDESVSTESRRETMQLWLNDWRAARSTSGGDDPIFQALSDAQLRFGIPDLLLEQLVEGTTMDLQDRLPGTTRITLAPIAVADAVADTAAAAQPPRELQVYETFDDLYRYCYLVASVVGLVCIQIFGYTDPRAVLLAEKTGVAFQLTNILRDVKEDMDRDRVYLPLDMLGEFNLSVEDVHSIAAGRLMRPNERAMLVGLSVQAWEYYEAGRELIPLLEPDSRAAMWMLIEIYSGLLSKIDQRQGDVFSSRVAVPTRQKIFALMRGAAMSMRARRT